MDTIIYAAQGDTIDLICWRHYGRTEGVTEQIVAQNRHLASADPVLDIGTRVALPEVVIQPIKSTKNLWE